MCPANQVVFSILCVIRANVFPNYLVIGGNFLKLTNGAICDQSVAIGKALG